jgi:hypothetical protein
MACTRRGDGGRRAGGRAGALAGDRHGALAVRHRTCPERERRSRSGRGAQAGAVQAPGARPCAALAPGRQGDQGRPGAARSQKGPGKTAARAAGEGAAPSGPRRDCRDGSRRLRQAGGRPGGNARRARRAPPRRHAVVERLRPADGARQAEGRAVAGGRRAAAVQGPRADGHRPARALAQQPGVRAARAAPVPRGGQAVAPGHRPRAAARRGPAQPRARAHVLRAGRRRRERLRRLPAPPRGPRDGSGDDARRAGLAAGRAAGQHATQGGRRPGPLPRRAGLAAGTHRPARSARGSRERGRARPALPAAQPTGARPHATVDRPVTAARRAGPGRVPEDRDDRRLVLQLARAAPGPRRRVPADRRAAHADGRDVRRHVDRQGSGGRRGLHRQADPAGERPVPGDRLPVGDRCRARFVAARRQPGQRARASVGPGPLQLRHGRRGEHPQPAVT